MKSILKLIELEIDNEVIKLDIYQNGLKHHPDIIDNIIMSVEDKEELLEKILLEQHNTLDRLKMDKYFVTITSRPCDMMLRIKQGCLDRIYIIYEKDGNTERINLENTMMIQKINQDFRSFSTMNSYIIGNYDNALITLGENYIEKTPYKLLISLIRKRS